MTQQAFAIAIDGPVASGKGTIAKLLAEKLHGFHMNTGAMYRALTLYCLENNIDLHNSHAVIAALSSLTFSLDNGVYMNAKEVTEEIKKREVTQAVPIVAAIAGVREKMVKRQRAIGLEKIAQGEIVLVDARDAATKIFPDAALKIFLTASLEVRARRRFAQVKSGESYEQILEDTEKRDYQDTHRVSVPLVSDPQKHGYLVIDNSSLSEDDTIALILKKIEEIYDRD